jgi:citrate lyase subunit beta/citryl-CoA lyase
MKSKVETLYGEANRALIREGLAFFGIEEALVEVEDSGAVPFVIMARLETAVRRLGLDNGKSWLPPRGEEPPPSTRDRFRRSRLYVPGDQPKLFLNAPLHQPDGLILDLEDSVAPANKDAARILVRNALRVVDFHGAERMVRINQLPLGLEDIAAVLPQQVDVILIPKVETPEQLAAVEKRVDELLQVHPEARDPFFMPIIESALGVVNAYPIATASRRNVALAIGLEDYTADIGAQRTKEGRESFLARCTIVNAGRAAGIQPIDTVFSDVADQEGLRRSVLEARALGFEGKGCIHPRQIAVIHEAFAPNETELERAKAIVRALEDAERRGLGVVALGSKMIDPPVVKRAQRTIDLAIKAGLLAADWRESHE